MSCFIIKITNSVNETMLKMGLEIMLVVGLGGAIIRTRLA